MADKIESSSSTASYDDGLINADNDVFDNADDAAAESSNDRQQPLRQSTTPTPVESDFEDADDDVFDNADSGPAEWSDAEEIEQKVIEHDADTDNVLELRQEFKAFWKCRHCSFDNHPSRVRCQSCSQWKNDQVSFSCRSCGEPITKQDWQSDNVTKSHALQDLCHTRCPQSSACTSRPPAVAHTDDLPNPEKVKGSLPSCQEPTAKSYYSRLTSMVVDESPNEVLSKFTFLSTFDHDIHFTVYAAENFEIYGRVLGKYSIDVSFKISIWTENTGRNRTCFECRRQNRGGVGFDEFWSFWTEIERHVYRGFTNACGMAWDEFDGDRDEFNQWLLDRDEFKLPPLDYTLAGLEQSGDLDEDEDKAEMVPECDMPTLEEALADIYSERGNTLDWLLAEPKHSMLQTTELVLCGFGDRGLKELKKCVAKRDPRSITFCLLRWPLTMADDTDKRVCKYVLGRFVGTAVEPSMQKTLSSKQQELVRPFAVWHLSLTADETMKGWTAENLNQRFHCASQPRHVFDSNGGLGALKVSKRRVNDQQHIGTFRGFASNTEAGMFGSAYYAAILQAMSSPNGIDLTHEVIDEYFDRNTTHFVGNGQAIPNVDCWVEKHQSFAEKLGPSQFNLEDFAVQHCSDFVIVATYRISIECRDGRKASKGVVSIVVNKQKKITHINETSARTSLDA